MVWKTLAESLESALASMVNEVGLEGGGTPSDAVKLPKGTGTEAPAKCQVNNEQRGKSHSVESGMDTTQPAKAASLGNAKGRRTHPHELAPLGVRQPLMLRVIEGGWTETGGNASVQPIRRARQGGTAAGEFLRLVV